MSTGTSRVPSVTERKDLSFVIAPEIRIAVQDWLESTAMPLVKDSIQRTSSKKLAEQIEQMSVKVIVHLILLLGNFHHSTRSNAAAAILQFGDIMSTNEKPLVAGPVLSLFATVEHGYAYCVSALFKVLGSSLSIMIMAIISSVELYQTDPDWRTRSIANAAISQSLWENKDKLSSQERLSVVWGLFFAFGSIESNTVIPDRMVIIKALHLLVPIYIQDKELSTNIIKELLSCNNKTVSEQATIKETVVTILDASLKSNPKSGLDPYYGILIELVSSQEESAYDMLPWTVETFFNKQGPRSVEEKNSTVEFSETLSNHFRASPSLIRYGAALALLSVVHIQNNFPAINTHLWSFIISGVLDSDFLTSGVYMQIIESIDVGVDTSGVKQLVGAVRKSRRSKMNYDEIFTSFNSKDESKKSRQDLLDLVAKQAPSLAMVQLHKLANALDYMTPKMKLKQLELIRVWGRKSSKLDIYIMKILIPLCASPTREVQLESIRVVETLLPGFSSASQNDVSFLWTYISKLLNPSMEVAVILAAVQLLAAFPIIQLNASAKEELFSLIFALCFHTSRQVRLQTYKFLGSSGEFWKVTGLMNGALAILMLCLGDGHPPNLTTLIEQITLLGGTLIGPILTPLATLKHSAKMNSHQMVRAYDLLANTISASKQEFKGIVDALSVPIRADVFWTFIMQGVPDNQLVRPEEYDYLRNQIQNPVWISILYTKLNIPPPPMGEGLRRDVAPSNPIGKRRFVCGYLQCLLPTLGHFNPTVRKSACIALLLCCFKNSSGYADIIQGVMEYITQHLLSSKYVTYQLSALEIFKSIVRCKLPGISESIFQQYLDLSIEFLHNAHSNLIQAAVLGLFEVFCLVFPKGLSARLQEIRDLTRPFIVDPNQEVKDAAIRAYPLIFHCATEALCPSFEEYLRAEIRSLSDLKSAESMADPLICHLTPAQAIRQLGRSNKAFDIAQFLMKFLSSPRASFRLVALTTVFSLVSVMPAVDASVTVWTVLPLYADLNYSIRLAWSRFRRNLPSQIGLRLAALLPHPEDNSVIPLTPWEEVLAENPILTVSPKVLVDITYELDDLIPSQSTEIPIEDDGFHLPTISEKLMARMSEVVAMVAHSLPLSSQRRVLYHLESYRDNFDLVPIMNLVLSEFAILHEESYEDTAVVLLSQLNADLHAGQIAPIESSILGLKNIMVNSRPMFKKVMEALVEQSFSSEGELAVMVYIFDLINTAPNVSFDLIEKFCAIASTTRHAEEKRILAAYLAAEISAGIGADAVRPVLDGLQSFLDSTPSNDCREKLYKIAGRLVPIAGDKHQLFRTMSVQSKKFLSSKSPKDRMQALAIFRIFAKTMTPDECMTYIFRFLADSDRDIREAARNAILDDDLVPKAMNSIRAILPETPAREALLAMGKVPAMEGIGIALNQKKAFNLTDSTLDEDPYNIKYYRSEQRRRFTKHYGLAESHYTRSLNPLTIGVMKQIDTKLKRIPHLDETMQAEDGRLRELQPLSVLQALIPFYPQIGESLVSELLKSVESILLPRTASKDPNENSERDLEVQGTKIAVLSNLLIAHGRSEIVDGWLSRIERFLIAASQACTKIRNSLYFDLEKSFYYQNQFADIPIVSDEQITALQDLRDQTQEAILDVIKSGKTEKVKLIDNRNDQWNEQVDAESDYLRELTILSLEVVSGYGMFYILTKDSTEVNLSKAFKFLAGLLDEEHRGLRLVVIEILVGMVKLKESFAGKEVFGATVKEVVYGFVNQLQNESHTLYRKKADLSSLCSQLISSFDDEEMQKKLLKLLIGMWRDGDSEVRQVSINMVQHLGECGVKPVIEAFKEPNPKKLNSIDLVKELVLLGNMADYPDKNILQDLLKWRFSRKQTA